MNICSPQALFFISMNFNCLSCNGGAIKRLCLSQQRKRLQSHFTNLITTRPLILPHNTLHYKCVPCACVRCFLMNRCASIKKRECKKQEYANEHMKFLIRKFTNTTHINKLLYLPHTYFVLCLILTTKLFTWKKVKYCKWRNCTIRSCQHLILSKNTT